jgi:hypothetical protein
LFRRPFTWKSRKAPVDKTIAPTGY